MSRFAGCSCVELADDEMSATFPALIMYPTDAPERPEAFGPCTADVALHGPVAAGTYPLVVISHGIVVSNLANRPRHLRLVIDWAFSSDVVGPHLRPDTVAIVGHPLGGYTALALAGGRPVAFPSETPDQQPRALDVRADDRVKALVLRAPATPWFMTAGAFGRGARPRLDADRGEGRAHPAQARRGRAAGAGAPCAAREVIAH